VTRPDRLYAAYVVDLDGTIYPGDELLAGARTLVEALRDRGVPVRFVSNNATRDPEQYAEKLARLGLPTPVADIVNTTVTMTRWPVDNHADAVVFPIAEGPLERALADAGIRTSHNAADIDIVVASYDRGFDYRKPQIPFDAIRVHRRATLVATNPDRFCPCPAAAASPTAPP
jgi:4-nitrophenyl phosphatase